MGQPRLTTHALDRARERGLPARTADAVRLPHLPRGAEWHADAELWCTASALLICRGYPRRVATVVELEAGMLAAVLCRLAFGVWELAASDGPSLPAPIVELAEPRGRRADRRGRKRPMRVGA